MAEKLTLTAYLARRGKKAKALKKVEADAFGIPYPLVSGWPARYGELEITETMLEQVGANIRAAKLALANKVPPLCHVQQELAMPVTGSTPTAKPSPCPGFVLRQARRYRSRALAPWA
jgi:hypothetical protein